MDSALPTSSISLSNGNISSSIASDSRRFDASGALAASSGDASARPAATAGAGRGGMAKLSFTLKAVAFGARSLDALAPTLTTRIMLRHFTRPRRKARHDYLHRLPAGARRITVQHGDLGLTGWCWGDSGPSVLLVHGWEDHSGSMFGFVEPLRRLGYRVWALDAPGHGLSPAAPTHLLDVSEALESLCREHGPVDSIIAHSFGAAAACLMLARAPELQPRRMALLSPMRDMQQHLEVFADIALLSPARAERLRRRVDALLGGTLSEVSALRALRDLAVPGLIVHDRHDPVIPHHTGELLAVHWEGARLISTSRLGHRRVLSCPRVLEEVLRLHQAG